MQLGEAVAFAFGVVFGAGLFVLALLPSPKQCPEVEGSKVVTTYHTNEGHYCIYEKSSQMRAKRVIKL